MMSSSSIFAAPRRALSKSLSIALVCMLLQACGSSSSCPEQDWFSLGKSEASAGHVGAWPQDGCPLDTDVERYNAGREAGLELYCLPIRGWQDGQAGTGAMPDCDQEGRGTYMQAWRLGDALHGFRERSFEIEAQLRDLSDPERIGPLGLELRQIENDIEAIRGAATVEGWLD